MRRLGPETVFARLGWPWQGEAVEGDPYRLGDRELTPVARVRRIGPGPTGVWVRWIEPVAVVERVGGQAHWLAMASYSLPAAAVLAALIAPVLAYVVGRAILAGRR